MGQIIYKVNALKQAMSVLVYALIVFIFFYHLAVFFISGFSLESVIHYGWVKEHFGALDTFSGKSLIGLIIIAGIIVPVLGFSIIFTGLLINCLFFPSTFESVRLFSKEALSEKYCSECNRRLSGISAACPFCKASFTVKN